MRPLVQEPCGEESGPRTIRVLIVDDHTIVRTGLRMLVESHPGLVVSGEASCGEESIDVLRELFAAPAQDRPDVVLMDLMMEGIGGIEATRRINREWPDLAVLILTMADDGAYLREAFAAGASGYVLKDAADMELVQAIHVVAGGERYLPPSLSEELAKAIHAAARGTTTRNGIALSDREIEVVRLVTLGYSNREIADELVISVRTVETHKTHIIQKTGLRTRSQMVRFALDHGLLRRR